MGRFPWTRGACVATPGGRCRYSERATVGSCSKHPRHSWFCVLSRLEYELRQTAAHRNHRIAPEYVDYDRLAQDVLRKLRESARLSSPVAEETPDGVLRIKRPWETFGNDIEDYLLFLVRTLKMPLVLTPSAPLVPRLWEAFAQDGHRALFLRRLGDWAAHVHEDNPQRAQNHRRLSYAGRSDVTPVGPGMEKARRLVAAVLSAKKTKNITNG